MYSVLITCLGHCDCSPLSCRFSGVWLGSHHMQATPFWLGLVFIPHLLSRGKLWVSEGASLQYQASPFILPPNDEWVASGPPSASPPHTHGVPELSSPIADGTCCSSLPNAFTLDVWPGGPAVAQGNEGEDTAVGKGIPQSLWGWQHVEGAAEAPLRVPSHPSDRDAAGPQAPASTNQILWSRTVYQVSVIPPDPSALILRWLRGWFWVEIASVKPGGGRKIEDPGEGELAGFSHPGERMLKLV